MRNLSVFAGRLFPIALAASLAASAANPKRTELSLNGMWDVAESTDARAMPASYGHTVPVPGLVHSAVPAFPQVDEFQSRELLVNLVGQKRLDKAEYEKLGDARGVSKQDRNYFWYHRTFTGPAKRSVALLRIGKAQFGIEVYLNGVKIGEHFPCFTSSTFDATNAIKWGVANDLVVRVGAHPGVLPANVSAGTDFEKNRWTPGIYDDVKLIAADDPVVTSVQVAPDIAKSQITVQTEVHNYAQRSVTTLITQAAHERRSGAAVHGRVQNSVRLAAGETRTITQVLAIPQAHLWSTEDPFLYELETATSGDSMSTRFGMREFRFDTPTRRAYLNGKPFFMRGSNITLHRFFEDAESGQLPWTEAWLQKLLVTIPKRLHWNSFRFCIGPVPDRWLEIADESGLLIQNEYLVWTGPGNNPLYKPNYDSKEMIAEYTEWMRDNWNHPSVAIWDATNESILPEFTDTIIPAVRGLDLSNRPWENGYNAPAGPDDPVEDHQYLFHRAGFKAVDLENMVGPLAVGSTSKTAHANILNEYGWLWLNRDGSPTLLTDKLYPQLLGKEDSTEARFALQDDLLQGETEFWRAYRHYAGVLHFVYLTTSDPRAFTADHFQSIPELRLRPGFETAMEQAFNPLGVYLNFWQPKMKAGQSRLVTVAMVNDEPEKRQGQLTLRLIGVDGQTTVLAQKAYELPPLGAQSYAMRIVIPPTVGAARMEAVAVPTGAGAGTVVSHRRFTIE